MRLLSDESLERSAVVANCRMNRERNLLGSNGYDRELGLNPLDFLKERAADHLTAWLDLCCGTGRALIQAARVVQTEGLASRIEIVGVDLVGMFDQPAPDLSCLRLMEASLSTLNPDRQFDLITCIHGLHYIGNKLAVIARAVSWLTDDGLFVANLDLTNLKPSDGRGAARRVTADLRRAGLDYGRKKRLVVCQGRKAIDLSYRYLGADDQAGPNYTGQHAVDSYYEVIASQPDR